MLYSHSYHIPYIIDLIKADTPYTTAKISRMLLQLEFKLQVERQYKKAIQQMTKLYQADGDKKSRMDAEGKRVESDKKIQLLELALKRYRNLHILDDAEADEGMRIPFVEYTILKFHRASASRRRAEGQSQEAAFRETPHHNQGCARTRSRPPLEAIFQGVQ